METKNQLKAWLETLTIAEHKKAVENIITRFEINRCTLYKWKRPEKKFSTIEREELNRISLSINNSKIFEV